MNATGDNGAYSPQSGTPAGQLSTASAAQMDHGVAVASIPMTNKGGPRQGNEGGVPPRPTTATGPTVTVFPINSGIFRCPKCKEDFVSARSLFSHRLCHESWELLFSCPTCSFRSPKPHAVVCHVPKCKGDRTELEEGPVKCSVCERGFKTKRGLSLHERHAHPVVRNEKRVAARTGGSKTTNAPRGLHNSSRWTPDEVEKLRELAIKHAGEKRINMLIQPHFPDKTLKQISDKRRGLKLTVPPAVPVLETREEERNPISEVHVEFDTAAFTSYAQNAKVALEGDTFAEEIIQTLTSVIEGNEPGPGVVDRYLTDIVSKALSSVNATGPKRRTANPKPSGKGRGGGRVSRPDGPMTRGERRAARVASYRRVQELFKKNTRQLAQELLDGSTSVGCEIPPITVEGTYRERFEAVAGEVDISRYPPPSSLVDNSKLIRPFTGDEVLKAIQGTKPGTAPGPDGVSLASIVKLDKTGHLLAAMFNIWLLLGRLPRELKANRSILLPKGSSNLHDIGNWRPLTLSSVVLRLYSRVLAARLSDSAAIHPRQKGFTKGVSLAENIELIKALCRRSKAQGEPLAVLFLDLAKAFDTVPHDLIQQALGRFGVCSSFRRIVSDMYSDCFTKFKVKGGETGRIFMRSGVKQGDPMSPVLFNLVLDPLITKLEKDGSGVSMGEKGSLCSLAYADDSCLVSSSHEGMQHNIDIAAQYFQRTGLRLNVKKSVGYMLKPLGKSFTVNDCPQWEVCGEHLPWLSPDETTKYLGARIGPWSNAYPSIRHISSRLQKWCENISKAPLKPRQKMTILTKYALPRLTFELSHGGYGRAPLKELDCTVRFWVRRWLHLPDQVSRAFFYTANKDGGLGLVCFADFIPAARMRNIMCVLNSADPVTKGFGAKLLTRDLDNLSRRNRWCVPKGKRTHAEWRKSMRKEWAAQTTQGKGVNCYKNNKLVNNWLCGRSFLSEREFLAALQLRTNTLPTKEALCRGRRSLDVLCRRCRRATETIGHISGHCFAVKRERIDRHNRVCSVLASAAVKAGFRVSVEPKIVDAQGKQHQPDLILHDGVQCLIVDPTVVWDGHTRHLAKAWDGKITKYTPLIDRVARLYNTDVVTVLPFPVGARGTWYHKCDTVAEALSLTKGDIRSILNKALCDTLRMCRVFMDM